MKPRKQILILPLFILTVSSSAAKAASERAGEASAVRSILASRSLTHLSESARVTELRLRRGRACEIQRRENVAPTLCYFSATPGKIRELNLACRSLIVKAVRLPKFDEFTSAECREAVERRALDLAYVERRDASR